MPRLKTISCPKCSAPIELRPGSSSVRCVFCGSTSMVGPSVPGSVVGEPARAGSGKAIALIAAFVVVVGMTTATFFLVSKSNPLQPPPSVPAAFNAPTVIPLGALAPPREAPVTQTLSGLAPLATDVDGDQKPELVAAIRSTLSGDSTQHFAVFDPVTGAERARTPAFEDVTRLLVAAIGRRLVLASMTGQLTGYDLASGRVEWSTALGDRVSAMCESGTPGAMHLDMNDERRLVVDLATGRQAETRESCTTRLASGEHFADPRDRRDYQAPAGVEAYHCGSARVMGDENYTVPDACLTRARINPERLGELVAHRMWRVSGGWLVFGIRSPGSYPMLGRLGRGTTFVWKSDVPSATPLLAENGGVRFAALVGEVVVVAYTTSEVPHSYVTAFALADGARRFTTPMLGDEDIHAMLPVGDAVAVQVGDVIRVLGVADGAVRATIGVEGE